VDRVAKRYVVRAATVYLADKRYVAMAAKVYRVAKVYRAAKEYHVAEVYRAAKVYGTMFAGGAMYADYDEVYEQAFAEGHRAIMLAAGEPVSPSTAAPLGAGPQPDPRLDEGIAADSRCRGHKDGAEAAMQESRHRARPPPDRASGSGDGPAVARPVEEDPAAAAPPPSRAAVATTVCCIRRGTCRASASHGIPRCRRSRPARRTPARR
jgi:hypothetical protein